MPTLDELASLYKEELGTRNMPPALKTTGWWVWSSEMKGSSTARRFDFTRGIERWDFREVTSADLGFAVRSRK